MAAALLAAYPNVFAAGGVVAGMPVGCARSAMAAMIQMRRANKFRTRRGLADDVRAATSFGSRRAWPRLTIWRGERDRTVHPDNAEALAAQWSAVHGLSAETTVDENVSGVRRRAWGRAHRPPSVELWTIADMGHGIPVGPDGTVYGAGLWVVSSGISAPERMAEFWGIDRPKSK